MSSLYITPADQRLIDGFSFYCYWAKAFLKIQFPPKITADSRKMNWNEHKTGWGVDPTANFTGNSGREISFKLEYIVESDQYNEGPLWTMLKIKYNVNLLKGIFTGFKAEQDDIGAPLIGANGQVLIKFRFDILTGLTDGRTFRVSAVNVEYSDEVVVLGRTPAISYPLKTTVTVSMTTYSLGALQTPNNDWTKASLFPKPAELWY